MRGGSVRCFRACAAKVVLMIEIELIRTGAGTFEVSNGRGAVIEVGGTASGLFTPIEMLLAAVAGCGALDVEHATVRHASPEHFAVVVQAEKVAGENLLAAIDVRFDVQFPDGDEGERARAILPRAVVVSHEKECTVSRTIEAGTPVSMSVA